MEKCEADQQAVRLQDNEVICLDVVPADRITGAVGTETHPVVEVPDTYEAEDFIAPMFLYSGSLLAAGIVIGRLIKSR